MLLKTVSPVVLTVVLLTPAVHAEVSFSGQVLPIFSSNCTKCHGEKKAMGKLRLHSAEAIQEKIAQDEHFIVAGDAEHSELHERITLPADNKKRMPKGGDPLDKNSIDIITKWINEGASFDDAVEKGPPADEASDAAPAAESESSPPAPEPLPEVAPASEAAVQHLTEHGALVMPLFSGSNLLDVSFALAEHPADDAALELLRDVAPQVVSLDLKGAQASDDGWQVLSELTNLINLKVHNSTFSDAAARNLRGLNRLESLNLYGTQVTDAALPSLGGLKRLRKLYLWKTKVSYDGAVALEKEIPGLEWNLGWDHPVVARKRLEQQQKDFTDLVKHAEAETARIKQELQVAEAAEASAKERLAKVEEELKTLSGSGDAQASK